MQQLYAIRDLTVFYMHAYLYFVRGLNSLRNNDIVLHRFALLQYMNEYFRYVNRSVMQLSICLYFLHPARIFYTFDYC